MIQLEPFRQKDYADLISWVDSAELMMQFAGPYLSFPLTEEQLDKSQEDKNRFAFSIVETASGKSIGHCEVYVTETSARFGRILIGVHSQRGKGLCKPIVHALITFVYNNIDRRKIELNVFDWNTGAIRCYEKAGFRINPDLKFDRTVNGKTWTAFNMILDNEVWEKNNPVQ